MISPYFDLSQFSNQFTKCSIPFIMIFFYFQHNKKKCRGEWVKPDILTDINGFWNAVVERINRFHFSFGYLKGQSIV